MMSRSDLKYRFVKGFVLPVGVLLILELIGRSEHLQSYSLAIPSQIFVALGRGLVDGAVFVATFQTLLALGAGVSLGTVIGLILGVCLGLSKPADRMMSMTVELIRPLPSVALIPVIILISGLGYETEIAVIAFGTTWPSFIFSRAAIRNVEPRLLEVARVLDLPLRKTVQQLLLPSILPQLFVGLRLGVGFALIIAITVEITTNPIGIGNAMMTAQVGLNPALMLAYLLWTGILGWALNYVLRLVEHAFFGGKP